MAKKIYTIQNLDCAHCAAKIEEKFNALPEVESAVIVFATGQLHLTAADPDSLLEKLEQIARTVEAGAVISRRESHSNEPHHAHEHTCGCGHHHEHDHSCSCGHHHEQEHQHHHGSSHDLRDILLGAGCFAAGLILSRFLPGIPTLIAFGLGYLVLGWGILGKAVRNLFKGHVLDENFLMGVASLGAFLIGEAAEGVGVMLFYRIGEYFEEKAMARSRSQIMEAMDLRPETVNLLEGEEVRVIPAGEARPGDLLLVRPGDRIPLDGTVLRGESLIDTAPITGEPVPVSARPGSELVSGCVNGQGQLVIRADKPLAESMVTRILNSVENAAASKPKIDRFITRFARVYTPIVVAAALAVAILPSLFTGDWSYWVYTALSFLVMSCPCALVLSVPLAYFSGIGAGGKLGILFKSGASMEAMHRVKAVVMDKTGTLTKGEFRVQQIGGGLDVLQLCASCEQQSTHPIARSITAAAMEKNISLSMPETVEEIPGKGIRAKVNGDTILCGSETLLREHGIAFDTVELPGSVVYVAAGGRFLGFVTIADTLKDGAKAAVARLKAAGVTTVMLTGDNSASAAGAARELGIDRVHAQLLPHEKLERLQAIRREAGAAMFVGDGINDAPVLAGADVGAAMGTGADAAIEAADVVFLTRDVEAIPEALTIARRTNSIAMGNVVFALGIKALVMVLGLLGHASMWLAVFADSGVAMLCVLNAIRLLYRRK